jgi:CMP-N,N'-diacetyllegionaminic acid synthase
MKNLGKIILHIPAREGSKRVPGKNMRNMNNKPMIAYAVEASIQSNITADLYVNTDSSEIIKFVREAYPNFKIYNRAKNLANDKASSEDFNLDIIKKLEPDTLVMINPVCPLIESSDIKKALDCYAASECDTLITSNSTQMQTFCEGEPVNINVNEQLAPSQSNKLITTLNWAVTIWDAKSFKTRMKNDGFASLGKKRVLFDINQINSFKVSEEKDFLFVEKLIQSRFS